MSTDELPHWIPEMDWYKEMRQDISLNANIGFFWGLFFQRQRARKKTLAQSQWICFFNWRVLLESHNTTVTTAIFFSGAFLACIKQSWELFFRLTPFSFNSLRFFQYSHTTSSGLLEFSVICFDKLDHYEETYFKKAFHLSFKVWNEASRD